MKRQRRGAGAGPARRALRGGRGDRGLIVLLPRGQRPAPAPSPAPGPVPNPAPGPAPSPVPSPAPSPTLGGQRAEPCPAAPAPSSRSAHGATTAPGLPPRWELEQPAPFRIASPSPGRSSSFFQCCFKKQTVLSRRLFLTPALAAVSLGSAWMLFLLAGRMREMEAVRRGSPCAAGLV